VNAARALASRGCLVHEERLSGVSSIGSLGGPVTQLSLVNWAPAGKPLASWWPRGRLVVAS